MPSSRDIDLPNYWGRYLNGELRLVPLVALLRGKRPGNGLTAGRNTRAKKLVDTRQSKVPLHRCFTKQMSGEIRERVTSD